MILHKKNAIIYGAGGSLGGAVAKALAGAGARVFLSGRDLHSVKKTADGIIAAGGQADMDEVDGFDEKAIANHLAKVVEKAGRVDISFNAIGIDVIQNIPLIDISADDFVRPITLTMQTRFLTAVAASKLMMKQGSGVILSLTATRGCDRRQSCRYGGCPSDHGRRYHAEETAFDGRYRQCGGIPMFRYVRQDNRGYHRCNLWHDGGAKL
jgi:NAD(P)-dependent dehydrogenase (short-subunit alcohol dehydrogenase family)